MKIIGHRGAKYIEPENTLRSIKRAIELGVSFIEIDVYICATGEVVVIHDESVDRTTNGTGLVREMSLQELKDLDAGKGEHIPTLQEVIELINKRISLIIEIKVSQAVEPVIDIIRHYIEQGWSDDSFYLASFNHYDLLAAQKLLPQIKCMPVFEGIPLGYTEFVRALNPKAIILYHGTITQEFVQDAHVYGIEVFAYTINKPVMLQRMKALGVDGVATDRPDEIHG
jgi:glycerophosphoryl diester phosphodiesterase